MTDFGKWNYREWAQKPKEKQDEFWKFFEQYVKRHERDAALNNEQGIVIIIDWEGFALGQYASNNGKASVPVKFMCLIG